MSGDNNGSGISQVAQSIGDKLAAKLFEARSRAGQRNAEVHLSEHELALAIAAGAQVAIAAAARVQS